MYRIELSPGEEALFRNIDELAKAIHSGVIGSHARIWHGASGKWLPIDFHPHYKIAKERPAAAPAAAAPIVAPVEPRPAVSPFAPPAQAAPSAPAPAATSPVPAPAPAPAVAAAQPPAPPKPAPKTRNLEFIELGPADLKPSAAPLFIESGPASSAPLFIDPPHQAATPRHIEALVAVAERHPAPVAEPQEEVLIDLGTPRRRFNPRIAGIAAGVLLTAAAGGAMLARGSAPEPAAQGEELAVASTSLAATPKPGFEIIPAQTPEEPGVAFRGNRAAEPVAMPAAEETKDSAAPVAPVVPAAPSLARASFKAGSDIAAGMHDAQGEFENRLRASGFTNLFAGARLTAGTVSTTRLAVAGAAGLVRSYRANASLEETAAGERTADGLLADVDAILGVLAGQEGGYEISGNTITFRDSASAREYGALRQRIATRISASSAAGAPVAESLVRALGAARLPTLAD